MADKCETCGRSLAGDQCDLPSCGRCENGMLDVLVEARVELEGLS